MISNEELLKESELITFEFFIDAIKTIDTEFGLGYAKEHPELIGSLMDINCKTFNNLIFIKSRKQSSNILGDTYTKQ